MPKQKTVTARLSQKALDALATIREWHAKNGVEITTSQVIESALVMHSKSLAQSPKERTP